MAQPQASVTDGSGGFRPADGQMSLGSSTTSTTLSSTMAAASLGTTVAAENANTSGEMSTVQPPAPPSGLQPAPPRRSGSMGGSQVGKQTRELKVEDALLYIDQVEVEFADKPHVYHEFLEILKNFRAQSINTAGVIERVKSLFRGHNKLILGFNTFLPEGKKYKIKITAEDEAAAAQQQTAVQDPVLSAYKPQAMPQQHAISYVTQIRNRFANEPDTYRTFLKILHTYRKEQKGIKDVLEQVSQLFADHPDLLMGFTYFLPDAVQEQAKKRLHRAAHQATIAAQEQANKARVASSDQDVHDIYPEDPVIIDAADAALSSDQIEGGGGGGGDYWPCTPCCLFSCFFYQMEQPTDQEG